MANTGTSLKNQGKYMNNETGLRHLAAGLFAAVVLVASPSPSFAQEGSVTSIEFSAQEKKEEEKKAAPAPRRAAPQRAAPHVAAPRTPRPRVAAPRRVAPQRTAPRTVTRPRTAPRAVQKPKVTPKVAAPASASPKLAAPAAAPRVVTPRGTRAVTASRLRGAPASGAGSTAIRGQNYSVWRSGYRVRHGNGWRTFVALGTLGAIAIGSNEYYPYAYISAPESYCEGLTEDGCELNWQEVQTLEGDVIDQCVAYCPWQ
jgi:hypothetical protein